MTCILFVDIFTYSLDDNKGNVINENKQYPYQLCDKILNNVKITNNNSIISVDHAHQNEKWDPYLCICI